MIFRAMANKLKEVNDKINNISDTVISDLACRIFFDGLLHPIPASTILKFSTGSSVTRADILTETCWINTSVQPSVAFYFSPVEEKDLYPVEAVFALAINDDGIKILWSNPEWDGRGEFMGHFEAERMAANPPGRDQVYIALKSMGQDIAIPESDIFIQASPDLLAFFRWSRWKFTVDNGLFGDPVVPGQNRLKDTWNKKAIPVLSLWGHNYYPYEHEAEYEECFFNFEKGTAGKTPLQLTQVLSASSRESLENLGPLYWIQIESDRKLPSRELSSFELAATNCAVGINAHFVKQNYFYHGPGPMEINTQNTAGEIYEIVSLDDNHGRGYSSIYSPVRENDKQCYYTPRIDGNVFRVIVNPPESGPVPDRFSLAYRISSGEAANGIDAGFINSLYNPHPGIESVINLTGTKGGTSARSLKDMIRVFPNVLQSHNRAVVPSDFESLAISFDKRIISARANTGSIERDGVLRSCIEMEIDVGANKFKLAEEELLFLSRLSRFLELRSPIGTIVTAKLAG